METIRASEEERESFNQPQHQHDNDDECNSASCSANRKLLYKTAVDLRRYLVWFMLALMGILIFLVSSLIYGARQAKAMSSGMIYFQTVGYTASFIFIMVTILMFIHIKKKMTNLPLQ